MAQIYVSLITGPVMTQLRPAPHQELYADNSLIQTSFTAHPSTIFPPFGLIEEDRQDS